jgi:hypothetical protein
MNKSTIGYGFLIFTVVVAAISLDYFSLSYQVESTIVSSLQPDGTIAKIKVEKAPSFIPIAKLLVNFLYTLAVGIFISIYIASRLERTKLDSKKKEIEELQRAINTNVFDSLFKTLMPEEIFKIIKSEIIESKIIRRNANWLYDFKVVGDDQIELKIVSHYELHNVSKDIVKNPIKLTLTSDEDEYKILEAKCISSDRTTTQVSYHHENDNNHGLKEVESSKGKVYEYQLDVPPSDYVEFTTTVSRTYKGDIYDSQFNSHPLVNAQLTVSYPEGYELEIDPLFSSELRKITTTYNQDVYKLTGGILPKQGFIYTLKKKKVSNIIQQDAA